MKIQVRSDSIVIEGYVNAIERDSKPLYDRVIGRFRERICKGAFRRAIDRNSNVHVLLNHDWARDLGSTERGNLTLTEDNIGLRARAEIYDEDVIQKGRNGELTGWSFGFKDMPDGVERRDEDGMTHRYVRDMDLREVSILDRSRRPAYEGTLISTRDDEEPYYVGDNLIADNVEIIDETKPTEMREQSAEDMPDAGEAKEIDYTKYEEIIAEMKGAKN